LDTKIKCERCGKASIIKAENGKLCLECWRAVRNEKRKDREQDSLNKCFSYGNFKKVTEREARIINDLMVELEKKGL
jgi:hypothetical protein